MDELQVLLEHMPNNNDNFAVFQNIHMHATAWGRRIGTSMARSPIIDAIIT